MRHRWSIITGYCERFNHNVYVTHTRDKQHEGPFIYIDNDRSQWKVEVLNYRHGLTLNNRLKDVCIFPRELSKRVLLLAQSQDSSFSLGKLVLRSMSAYEDALYLNGPMFTEDLAEVMDANVRYLGSVISRCIAERGEDAVLIPEPWHTFHQDRDFYRRFYHGFGDLMA